VTSAAKAFAGNLESPGDGISRRVFMRTNEADFVFGAIPLGDESCPCHMTQTALVTVKIAIRSLRWDSQMFWP
jgi:hypothetical protein